MKLKYIRLKNKIYLIDASAKNEDRKIYEKFVMSLMLNGKPLFKDPASDPTDASPSVIISTLQTSAEINEVLNQKQEKSEVKVVKSVASVKEDDVGQNYSRPLIILRRPDFEFIDAASRSNSSGLVKLKVTFLASGKIGEIAIVSDLSNGLTKFAIKAASKIKFLPAEIDGKKVDATKTIEYGFNVR